MTDDKTKIAADTDEHFVALHSGFTLGKYELQAVLGQGGFGITYKAWDSALNRAVAIKEYLPSDVAVRVDGSTVKARSRNDQESFQWGLERFLEEARALARFEATQSIVRVYDYMQANGTAYMVMALIEGTPLSSVYRREAPLSEERLKAIVLPILDGLDDVHLAGFLHRDIKPANILIRPNGSPVLIDFGAARNALGEKSRSITSVFTPGYAPFEQYTSSGKQGPWTDIYALAATLYHGITGKPPPQATDRIRDDPMLPAVHAGAGHYSPQFLASIDRGLEVFENRRPQSIGQWRDMLTGATTLAVPQSYAAPQQGAAGYAPNSQPGNTAVPTLGERGVPSQAPNSQGPVSQGPVSQGPVSQGPASQAPYSQTPVSQAPRKSRMPLIAAAIALVLVGGGAAAFFAFSPSTERAAEETVQQRAQRLADEAKRAADQARLAQDAAEAEMKKRAEQEAAQKAAEETRRRADADLARQAEQARREAERAQRDSDGEARRKADEEVRKIAEAEAARRLESEKLEQERRALEVARAKAEAELAEARRQADEARSQAEALRAQAEQSRAAAAEADARRKAEDEARKKAEAEAKIKAEAAAKKKAEDDAKAKADAAIAAKKKAEDEARAKAEAAAKAKADEEARRAQAARAPAPAPAPAAAPAPVAAPPPPISSADVRAAPAPSTQQAANAPTTPGFAYAGRYGVVIDCPQVDQPPFAQYGTSIAGPQFSWDFYRDGKGTGTISGDSMSYRISFTGRSGNSFTGSFSLRATAEGFRGSGIVSGFGPNRNGEKSCPIMFTKR